MVVALLVLALNVRSNLGRHFPLYCKLFWESLTFNEILLSCRFTKAVRKEIEGLQKILTKINRTPSIHPLLPKSASPVNLIVLNISVIRIFPSKKYIR